MVNARPDPQRIARLASALLIAVVTVPLVAMAPASAQDNRKVQRERYATALFEAMDTNKDKSVTLAEYKTLGKNEFKAVDKDKNGSISQAEFVGRRPQGNFSEEQLQQIRRQLTIHFVELDHNGDGIVTAAEHDKVGDRTFRAFDRDGNGKISLEEMKSAAAAAAQQ